MSYAKERAGEFDQLYCDLRDKVGAHEESAEQQGNIRSEVEAVKEQMEEHKARIYIVDIGALRNLLFTHVTVCIIVAGPNFSGLAVVLGSICTCLV